ncbi:MAG TPA: helicase HerA-like domain-containing protein, partial [Thermoanaerobaculia bacterium]|nr:helicase HerA-like domain-containing protein [Thermoanaerobaculia bacterium]
MATTPETYEKLGALYLGREFDLERGAGAAEPLLYDSRDLVTHGLIVGMTGSGKTGLTISLLEEAALDGVPALVIDPKGDLSNLLLTFPELRPEDFAPWVDPEEARRAGRTAEEHAAHVAAAWRAGLAEWGQSGERIARLRAAADFAIYTPGSTAGLPVSILASLAAPAAEVLADGDLLRERVGTLVASLLTLLGRDADPVQSRDHVFLSTIVDAVWRTGRGLDLPGLIQAVQRPPVERVGVLDLESFYPERERFALAMALNNLLAAPGFRAWLEGAPLDVGALLHTAAGKPRVAIFSLAHLADAERVFFVALLLNQTLGWMRTRPGTGSLRALLVIDELFGFAPPVAEPPSKRPLLTLLKQARAFGLGVVVATQNPVDLDYKGLGNIGTWWIGRLQTERDRERLLDGLQGAAAGAGLNRGELTELLGRLAPRLFLMRNVHEDKPVVLQSRWAMSYLRGPLTRVEIQRLMGETPAVPASGAVAPAPPPAHAVPATRPVASEAAGPPVLPPDIEQVFFQP